MTITRIINGVKNTFELTDNELLEAYEKQQFKYDLAYCTSQYDNMSADDFADEYGVEKDVAKNYLGDIASEMRHQINKFELNEDYARTAAFTEVLSQIADE